MFLQNDHDDHYHELDDGDGHHYELDDGDNHHHELDDGDGQAGPDGSVFSRSGRGNQPHFSLTQVLS